jgi:hypothetical protein
MSKIYNVLSIALFLFVAIITSVHAEEPAATTKQARVLANVNIYQPMVVSQENGVLTVGFDIANNADIAQGDIKYGLDVIKVTAEGQTVVDSYVSPDPIALAAKTTAHKEIAYAVPANLSGEYEVWVISRTTSGMMLGLGRAGVVTFTNTAPYVDIVPETCTITVSGDANSYNLYQGVDVAAEETLNVSCTLESHFTSDITITPAFSTHKRTRFGDVVETTPVAATPITLSAGEKKEVTFAIPKATVPQAYDVSMSFVSTENKTISNEVIAHYVLRGASATIQTATLDKVSYAQGETLSARILWSPSADSFMDSRGGQGTALPNTALTLVVTDTNGNQCSEPITRPLTASERELTIETLVTAHCESPRMAITIRDDKGTVLDARTVDAPEMPVKSQTVAMTTTPHNIWNLEMFILLITTISALMILYVVLTMRAIMRGEMVLKK